MQSYLIENKIDFLKKTNKQDHEENYLGMNNRYEMGWK